MRLERGDLPPATQPLRHQPFQRGAGFEHTAAADILGEILQLGEARSRGPTRQCLGTQADGLIELREQPLEPGDPRDLSRERQLEAQLEATVYRPVEQLGVVGGADEDDMAR